jgi:hypothetical protein
MGAVVSWKRREERLNPGEVFCDDFLRIEKGVENRRADGIKVTFSALFAERIRGDEVKNRRGTVNMNAIESIMAPNHNNIRTFVLICQGGAANFSDSHKAQKACLPPDRASGGRRF